MNSNQKSLIKAIESSTGLTFLHDRSYGNLCFANNNEELRDEFKSSFDLSDLKFYMKAFESDDKVKPPLNSKDFWEKVNLGKEIK